MMLTMFARVATDAKWEAIFLYLSQCSQWNHIWTMTECCHWCTSSDNAPQFVSDEFQGLLARHGIQNQKFPPLWPQSNEKSLKVADKQCHAVNNSPNPWDKVLLKNTKLSGKLASNFVPKPYTVQIKEGQELTLKLADGIVQRGNRSFVKP